MYQFQGMDFFQYSHLDACRNLFVDIKRNGEKYTRSLHNHPVVTIISDLYKVYLPRRSKRNIRGRPRVYNVLPVTEIGGDVDYGTAATDVLIITMTP